MLNTGVVSKRAWMVVPYLQVCIGDKKLRGRVERVGTKNRGTGERVGTKNRERGVRCLGGRDPRVGVG